jgi:Putative transposase
LLTSGTGIRRPTYAKCQGIIIPSASPSDNAFQVHLVAGGMSSPALNQTVCALHFLYGVILQLPVPYFHVVFTMPAAAAEIAFQNKRVVYAILFRAAAEAMRDIAADPRHVGAEVAAVAVLHTWGQTLHHHPHLHCIVLAGGLSPDQSRWVACRPGFFLPVRLLSRRFRNLFTERLHRIVGSQATNCGPSCPRSCGGAVDSSRSSVISRLEV